MNYFNIREYLERQYFNNKLIWIIVLVGFIVRSVFILLFNENFYLYDAPRYLLIAENIINKGEFSAFNHSFHSPPITPLLYSLIILFFGVNVKIIALFQTVFSCASVFLIFFIGKTVFSRIIGIVSASICALYPYFIWFNGILITETFALFFLLLYISMIILIKKINNPWFLFMIGIVGGLANLTKSIFFFMSPFVLLFIIYVMYSNHQRMINIFRGSFSFILGLILIMSPWIYRNYSLSEGRIIPVTKDNGVMLYLQIGRYLDPNYEYQKHMSRGSNPFIDSRKSEFENDKIKFELKMDDYYSQITFDLILDYPTKYLSIVWKNFYRFWAIYPFQYHDEANLKYLIIGLLSFGIFVPFFIYGCVNIFRERSLYPSLLILIIIYFTIIHSLILGMIRYRIPIDPLFILISVYGIDRLFTTKDIFKRLG